jgi:hypothetical protein
LVPDRLSKFEQNFCKTRADQQAKEEIMQFNLRALMLTTGLLWGGAVLLVAIANLIWTGYGAAFLQLVASIYPGYQAGTGIGSVVLVTIYAFIDGAIGGAIFGWLYNTLSKKFA